MFLGCFMCPSPSLPHPPPPPPSSPAPSTNQIGFLWYLVVFFLTITFVFFLQLLSSSSSSSSSSFQCLWAVDDETERVGLSSRDSLDALNLIFTFKKWTKKIDGYVSEERRRRRRRGRRRRRRRRFFFGVLQLQWTHFDPPFSPIL